MRGHEPVIVPVGTLFAEARYSIPLYQRAYAWGKDEIETLLRDIQDYQTRKADSYYIGSLVVHADDRATPTVYEVVDGQQRLTTLFLVLCHPRFGGQKSPELLPAEALTFEGRQSSNLDLQMLAERADGGRSTGRASPAGADIVDAGIKAGDATIGSWLATNTQSSTLGAYRDYLLDHVKLVRTELPQNTDLNHYFEVMNNRGEQLEKHEIVKAELVSRLDERSRAPFATIWDACSDMTRYVQAHFPTAAKTAIFGSNWDKYPALSFDGLAEALSSVTKQNQQSEETVTLGTILEDAAHGGGSDEPSEDRDESGRYGSIIDFPNFLLHALKVHRGDEFAWERGEAKSAEQSTSGAADSGAASSQAGTMPGSGSPAAAADAATGDGTTMPGLVSLDDKQLIEVFKELDGERVKSFAVTLLRLRYLFDTYVIKTTGDRLGTDDSNWVLKRAYGRTRQRRKGSDQTRMLATVQTFGERASDVEGSDAVDSGLQKQIIMLQSMFQVTDSGRTYKNFLYGILTFLHRSMDQGQKESGLAETDPAILGAALVDWMHKLASTRYQLLRPTEWATSASEAPALGVVTAGSGASEPGATIPHFVFNYLDYLLWLDSWSAPTSGSPSTSDRSPASAKGHTPIAPEYRVPAAVDFAKFRFRYRNSMEHFYPQHPDESAGHETLDARHLHNFGNLCLMTRSQNSRRSNLMPVAKIGEYSSADQSLKFQFMAAVAESEGWGSKEIEEHEAAMKRRLKTGLPDGEQ